MLCTTRVSFAFNPPHHLSRKFRLSSAKSPCARKIITNIIATISYIFLANLNREDKKKQLFQKLDSQFSSS